MNIHRTSVFHIDIVLLSVLMCVLSGESLIVFVSACDYCNCLITVIAHLEILKFDEMYHYQYIYKLLIPQSIQAHFRNDHCIGYYKTLMLKSYS